MRTMIIGGGKVGTFVASSLLAQQHQVKLIEVRREEFPRLEKELSQDVIVLGSGTDPVVLERAGIRTMEVVAAVTGDDETNLVVTNLARMEFNVPRTIARVNNPKNAWMFTPDMGVDVALNQSDLMCRLILEEMSLGDMMTLLKLRKGQYSIVEEKVDPSASVVGKSLNTIPFPPQCVLVAVIRREGMEMPHSDLELRPADEVIALVHSDAVQDLANLLGPKKV